MEAFNMIYQYNILRTDNKPKLKVTRRIKENNLCTSTEWLLDFLNHYYDLNRLDTEQSYCIAMDDSYHIRGILLVSSGSDNHTYLYKRNIAIFLCLLGANEFYYIHNHPNNSCYFSENDMEVNKLLVELSELLEIKLSDSIVMTKFGWQGIFDDGSFLDDEGML